MKSSDRSPAFRPFFSTDQATGSLGPNSAGSVANAKLEQLLRDKESPRKQPLLDSEIHRKRQVTLDDYNGSRNHGDRVRHDGYVVQLSQIASPLPVPHSLFQDRGKTEKQRSVQLSQLENTYLKGKFEITFNLIDKAVEESSQIRSQLINKKPSLTLKKALGNKKNPWDFDFSLKEQEIIHAPIHRAVKEINQACSDQNILVRLRWRTFLRDDGERATNLFFIFPTIAQEVKDGPQSWDGMKMAHSRDAESRH